MRIRQADDATNVRANEDILDAAQRFAASRSLLEHSFPHGASGHEFPEQRSA
jgi:hypothetical protein